MNNKGDKVISVYWFFILFIVAGAVVYMVLVFYGKPFDVREVEAQILSDRVSQCLNIGGYLNTDFQNFNNDNFLDKCSLNFNTEQGYGWNNDQYYVKVDIIKLPSNENIKTISVGNSNLNSFCFSYSKNLPFCLTRSVYSLDSSNNQYIINITSVIRKTEKNVQ